MPRKLKTGRIKEIRIAQHGMHVYFSHSFWLFWSWIPGMRRRKKHTENRGLYVFMPNLFSVQKLVDLLDSLPLARPDVYLFTTDTTDTLISRTPTFLRRGDMRTSKQSRVYRPMLVGVSNDGRYKTEVVLKYNNARRVVKYKQSRLSRRPTV